MKALWLCNIVLPQVCKIHDLPIPPSGGWITAMMEGLQGKEQMEFYVLSPVVGKRFSGKTDGFEYCLFDENDRFLKDKFKEILTKWKPDLIHVFGTEFPHSLVMVEAAKEAGMDEKVLISIQGLTSMCGKHYRAFLPDDVCRKHSFRDFVKMDNIAKQQKLYITRGQSEIQAIKSVRYVVGRTKWDKVCVERINPEVTYFKCNENLRSEFYSGKWDCSNIEEHSIFTSQCSYPLKGFHLMLEAMKDIVKKYPDAHLYTTGMDPLLLTWKQRLKQTYYNRYLGQLIVQYGLEKQVAFLPALNADEMKARYLKSNVFVCCSSIENSSNSLGEAMLLGVPCVAAYTGGTPSMISSNEGYLYQADAPYMLANGICRIFESKKVAQQYSESARIRARITHDTEINLRSLLQIYQTVAAEK